MRTRLASHPYTDPARFANVQQLREPYIIPAVLYVHLATSFEIHI
jgi:hypothetical protein